jgi:predicted DNA-binding transcriptional regulator AlpA
MDARRPTSITPSLISLFRRGLSREQASNYIGVSATTFDKLVKEGRMPKAKHVTDGRIVWDLWELDAAFDKLDNNEEAPKQRQWDSL